MRKKRTFVLLSSSLCRDDIPKFCGINNKNGEPIEPKWLDDSQYQYCPFYNGPPTTKIPVVICDTKRNTIEDANYFLVPMKWGYTPNFVRIKLLFVISYHIKKVCF